MTGNGITVFPSLPKLDVLQFILCEVYYYFPKFLLNTESGLWLVKTSLKKTVE